MVRITVKTLAAAVGVSPATVSNAYNRPDQLSAELRERILATAAQLGYSGPDPAGRTLRVGRAEAVGVLLSERLSYAFSDPFAVEFLAGLSEVAEQHGISIVLMPVGPRGPAHGEADASSVLRANIDALTILSITPDHPAFALARARGIRVVTTDATPDPESSWVAIDDHGGGVTLGQHLLTLGHRDVAVIAETQQPVGSPARALAHEDVTPLDYAARLRGLRETMPGAVTLVTGGHNAEASGFSAAAWLIARRPRPTAIVALSDVLALGALRALRDHGRGRAGRGIGQWLRRHPRGPPGRADHGPPADPGEGPAGRPQTGRSAGRATRPAAADRTRRPRQHGSATRPELAPAVLGISAIPRVGVVGVLGPGQLEGQRRVPGQCDRPGQQFLRRAGPQQADLVE